MKSILKLLLGITMIVSLPLFASAQAVDNFGVMDTLYAELGKIDNTNWSITISLTNDENVVGLSIPLKFSAGNNRIVADSAIYAGGRADNFSYKGVRPDTAIQCVTLGMIANLGPSQKSIAPGKGRLVTIFISSLDNETIENMVVDTTTTSPNNSLMVIAGRIQGAENQDTIPITDREIVQINPQFVVIEAK